MAYETIEALPQEAKSLPTEAQNIFMTAFNSAEADGLDANKAQEVAWNSVKNTFAQDEQGNWRFRAEMHHHNPRTGTMPQS